MGHLNIKNVKIEEAKKLYGDFDITLKRDGTLLFWKDKKLISPRDIDRTDRFEHIAEILIEANFPDCMGEMYIEGGNVFDITSKKNWSFAKFMPIYANRDLAIKIKQLNSKYITDMKRFKTIEQGWEYVVNNNLEGLILRNDNDWFKVKLLQEAKIKIVDWEKGSEKGTFILENDNRISGTSVGFVNQFFEIKAKKQNAIAEIEFCFITDNGHFFQPRLRRIFEGIENAE